MLTLERRNISYAQRIGTSVLATEKFERKLLLLLGAVNSKFSCFDRSGDVN